MLALHERERMASAKSGFLAALRNDKFRRANFRAWLPELPESVRYCEAADSGDELAVGTHG